MSNSMKARAGGPGDAPAGGPSADLGGCMVILSEEDGVVYLQHRGRTIGYLQPGAAVRLGNTLRDFGQSLMAKYAAEHVREWEGRLEETGILEL